VPRSRGVDPARVGDQIGHLVEHVGGREPLGMVEVIGEGCRQLAEAVDEEQVAGRVPAHPVGERWAQGGRQVGVAGDGEQAVVEQPTGAVVAERRGVGDRGGVETVEMGGGQNRSSSASCAAFTPHMP